MRRDEIVKSLGVDDFSEGPKENMLNDLGDMWVFGKNVKGKEVYIKITLGKTDCRTVCISFHLSEYPMTYPFKNQEQ